MCVGSLAEITYLRYTVLTSPKKGETAVHSCDPALSVLIMLVSRNVFHVVSALQSIVFIHFFLADQVSCRSYVAVLIVCGPLQLFSLSVLRPAAILFKLSEKSKLSVLLGWICVKIKPGAVAPEPKWSTHAPL